MFQSLKVSLRPLAQRALERVEIRARLRVVVKDLAQLLESFGRYGGLRVDDLDGRRRVEVGAEDLAREVVLWGLRLSLGLRQLVRLTDLLEREGKRRLRVLVRLCWDMKMFIFMRVADHYAYLRCLCGTRRLGRIWVVWNLLRTCNCSRGTS